MTINQIGDTNLFVGNSNDARDIDNMRRLDITSSLNVAKDLEAPWFHGNFNNYKVSLLDGPGNKTYQYVLATQVALTLLGAGEKLLIHCHSGMSRSPAIAAIVLVLLGKVGTLLEAYNLICRCRPVAHINDAHWPLMEEALEELNSTL
jgi:protein-tyrosine phosphatase